jgi:uncharacterized protein YaaN involved in tellurite resistance
MIHERNHMNTSTALVPKVDLQPLTAAALGPSANRQQLVCKNLLEGDTLAQAKAAAKQEYPAMLDNALRYAQFGNSALDGVNDLIDSLLDKVKLGDSPEAKKIIKTMSANLDGIRRKYDVSDPKIEAKYANMRDGAFSWLNGLDRFWRMILRDIKSMETQVDDASQRLQGHQSELTENVAMYDALYAENEKEIAKLIFTIAVMELIVDEAVADMETIPVGESGLGDRGGEQRAKRGDLINNLNVRIGNFKSRLFIAWATSPQVRTIQTLTISQLGQIDSLINIAVPSLKGILIQMTMLQRSKDAAGTAEVIKNTLNGALQQHAASTGVVLPLIANSANMPMVTVETINAVVTGYLTATDGIARAIQAGAEERSKLEDAMVTGKAAMENASANLTDAIVEQAISAAKPLEITTTVLSPGQATV